MLLVFETDTVVPQTQRLFTWFTCLSPRSSVGCKGTPSMPSLRELPAADRSRLVCRWLRHYASTPHQTKTKQTQQHLPSSEQKSLWQRWPSSLWDRTEVRSQLKAPLGSILILCPHSLTGSPAECTTATDHVHNCPHLRLCFKEPDPRQS